MINIYEKSATRVVMLLLAVAAFSASLILLLEKLQLAADKNYTPVCNLNPIFSCSGPMNSWQAEALGIPNPILGIIGFAIVSTILAVTLTNATLPRFIWRMYLLGLGFAFLYSSWLVTQTLYDIGALCINCIVVWVTVIPLFWVSLRGYLRNTTTKKIPLTISRLCMPLMFASYALLIALVYTRFDLFFNSLLPG